MKIVSQLADRILELAVPRAHAAAETCYLDGCCDSQYVRQVCYGEHGGSSKCIYMFGGCRLPGGGGGS
ncbi:hypothetical protein [Pseudonocardia sp. TRM90224]|uniref:hypothetical protein n=1 Tax=Pseudonocardia sp. TRM90224 TaxID=2812678 RepID=UPI001E4DC2C1|nr:hypothetical protein [Pseudonocardia sp. TRM90224]